MSAQFVKATALIWSLLQPIHLSHSCMRPPSMSSAKPAMSVFPHLSHTVTCFLRPNHRSRPRTRHPSPGASLSSYTSHTVTCASRQCRWSSTLYTFVVRISLKPSRWSSSEGPMPDVRSSLHQPLQTAPETLLTIGWRALISRVGVCQLLSPSAKTLWLSHLGQPASGQARVYKYLHGFETHK